MPGCCICSAHPYKDKVSVFKIPKDPWRRQRWSKACNRIFTDTDRLCERHFVRADFIDIPGTRINKRLVNARLLPCAVPSLFFEKYDPRISRSRLHVLQPNDFKMKENIRKQKISMDRFDRFGFPTGDPTTEGQRIKLEESDVELEISLEDCIVDDINTKKCGRIFYNIDEEVFTLSCFFCSTICLDLLTFSEHVKKQHSNLSKEIIENHSNADIKIINVLVILQNRSSPVKVVRRIDFAHKNHQNSDCDCKNASGCRFHCT